MKESTNKKKGTLTIEDNYKIVSLIKAKINPIQKKSHSLLPRNMNMTAPNFHPKPSKEYQIIDRSQLNTFEILSKCPQTQLLRRTKMYLEENRKKLKMVDKPANSNIDLKMYIKIFDEESHKQNPIVQQFLKMKRQSMQFLSLYDKPKRMQTPQAMKQISQKTQQQCSLLNARIRRRLNHKKIIALYKYS